MAMFQSKKASLPLRGFNVDYQKPAYSSKVDKRPIFYPLLISFVHTLRGYSAYNGFVVNFICGILVLFVFYLFIHDHFPRVYALISILTVASLPNFVTWVTSSGFETLNLFFIVFTLFLFNKVLYTRSIQHAELLWLTLVLLSQCRYESIIFTVAILFLLPILLNKKSIARFSIISYVVPILFIPTLWLFRLYADRPIIDKMAMGTVSAASLSEAFSVSNLLSNTSTNVIVFLGLDPHLGFSPVISAMSAAGIYLITKKLIVDRKRTSSQFQTMWLFGFLTFSLLYVVQVSFYLGNMSIYTQNRFAMAYLPVMVFPVVYFVHHLINHIHISKKVVVFVLLSKKVKR
ncbi:MAG: glycosyltransferase family 39 protein [bacterium]|nr:glycosyltransferase family 39 protein [bacterium]